MKRRAAVRVPGWFMNRLKVFTHVDIPEATNTATLTTSYKKVPGFNKQVRRLLFLFQRANGGKTIHHRLTRISIFREFGNFFINALIPEHYNIYWLHNAYLIKLLFTRSYRAERMLLNMPAHGQRRWSNAITAKKLNTFLERVMRECEEEIFNYRKKTRRVFTKLDEMRMKAKMRTKKKTKKFTKFKKFGERKVAAKKKKKTPWQ